MGRPAKMADPNIERPTSMRRKVTKDGEAVVKTKSDIDIGSLPKLYKCTYCGCVHADGAEKRFFVVPHTKILDGNDRFSSLCMTCCSKLYVEYAEMFKSQKLALLLLCSLLGAYFSERLYESMAQKDENGDVPLGKYLRSINGVQYRGKTFLTYLVE